MCSSQHNSRLKQFTQEAKELVGCQVVYAKPGGREGWVGEILSVDDSSVTVSFFEMNVIQPYALAALALPSGLEHPGSNYSAERNATAYLVIKESVDYALYLIAGEKDGEVRRVFGYDRAVAAASKMAAESKSGQAYIVFKAAAKAQRELPQIKITEM